MCQNHTRFLTHPHISTPTKRQLQNGLPYDLGGTKYLPSVIEAQEMITLNCLVTTPFTLFKIICY